MKKVVLKLSIQDEKDKRNALKEVSKLIGIDSIAIDMKESKLTVIGNVDPVRVVNKLSKKWGARILTVGPAKEDGKKKDSDEQLTEAIKAWQYNQLLAPSYYVKTVEEYPSCCVIC